MNTSAQETQNLRPIHQLGYVVSDIEKASEHYASVFGIGPFSPAMEVDMSGAIYRGKPTQTKIKVAFAKSGDLELELIQPVEGENPYFDYLASHGDGIHHLAFLVDDMEPILEDYAARGLEPTFHHDMGVMDFAYFDTSEAGGLWIEFLHWKADAV
jgi:catechol 2,3-dioxygenase-like lactoylglutathione lyase family enzyme